MTGFDDELAAIVRGTTDAIVGKSLDGRITSWNEGAERLYGFTADEIIGQPITTIIPTDRRAEEELIFEKVHLGEAVPAYLTRRQRKDGALVDISLTVAPIRDLAGVIVGASAIARDITALQHREAQLTSLIEAAPDAFIVVGATGLIQFVNQQTENLFGYPRIELMGQPIEMLVPDRARSKHPDLRGSYGGQPTARPMRGRNLSGRRKDGSEFSVDISLTPLYTSQGLLVAAAVRDATERKEAEARFEALLESAPDAIVVADDKGTIAVANHRATDLFGYSRDELIGHPVEMLVPQQNRDGHPDLRRGYVAHPAVRPMGAGLQLWAQRKDGSKFPVDISLAPLETPAGILVSAAVRDITDRLAAEEALRAAKEEAEQANLAKSEFLSRMSHELRTPLTAILGFTELLQLGGMPADQRDLFVDRTHRAGQHLLSLINDVLDISRVEAGSLAMSIEAVDAAPLVEDAIELIAPMAQTRRIAVANTVRDAAVMADSGRLRQVLLNLLSNAVKYNREAGAITISSRAVGEIVSITVSDTGPGISEQDLPRLFQPFERLGVQTGEIEGTGIGLAISRGLVDMMGGTIEVASVPGEGTRFTVSLPTAEHLAPAKVSTAAGDRDRPTATVLYIEDNASNTVLVESALSMRPQIRFISAVQGQLGLELARDHRPDLVLLDLHLPDMTGEAVLAGLKADERTAAAPVIIVSADATKNRIRELLAAGAHDYITKPLVIKDFLASVDTALAAGP
ncbi:MAG TPA: PAS domain S-box protein [Aeromicrobium sp.]|nr:PAS domain S-box protein [Aeromicrobium sp.]